MDPSKALKSMAELENEFTHIREIRSASNMLKAVAPAFGVDPRAVSEHAYAISSDGGDLDTFMAVARSNEVGIPEYVDVDIYSRQGPMHGWTAAKALKVAGTALFERFVKGMVDGRSCLVFKAGTYWVMHNLEGWSASTRPHIIIPSDSSSVDPVVMLPLKSFLEDRLCLTS